MADLFPTPSRRALLAAIQAGEVTGYPRYKSDQVDYYLDDLPGHELKVTKRVEELLRQDPPWACEGSTIVEDRAFKVALTEAGRKVLEASRG